MQQFKCQILSVFFRGDQMNDNMIHLTRLMYSSTFFHFHTIIHGKLKSDNDSEGIFTYSKGVCTYGNVHQQSCDGSYNSWRYILALTHLLLSLRHELLPLRHPFLSLRHPVLTVNQLLCLRNLTECLKQCVPHILNNIKNKTVFGYCIHMQNKNF